MTNTNVNKCIQFIVATVLSFLCALPAHAWRTADHGIFSHGAEAQLLPAAGVLEVAFSPNEGSETLVRKVIDSAVGEIKMLAYSFTSESVVEALLRAKKRGVAVSLVVDEKSNISEDRSGKARAALSVLANAGADVRIISVYPIHHDKVIIVDQKTVELGSYNYSAAAASRNSENVLVNWGNPKLAQAYLSHFNRNWRQAGRYHTRY